MSSANTRGQRIYGFKIVTTMGDGNVDQIPKEFSSLTYRAKLLWVGTVLLVISLWVAVPQKRFKSLVPCLASEEVWG
ncbi:hypothetical protein BDV23DRAFT_164491 [Aspergillus alliaceus]|uniref:Uncharacterized protein n=1 Tax=Petromyces alliaceus TaxID=209559 RepID=A0A5N7BW37_PETAA|nr:hypothetical protein BDV23DRAFT_164491 [Aspergillus alliaceus]